MFKVRKKIIAIALIAAIALLISSTSSQAKSRPAEDRAGGPQDRIEVVLKTDGAPAPGGTSTLTIEATPLIDAPNLQIQWVIPPGVTLTGSTVENLGAVSPRQTVTSQRQIQFPAQGTYKIAAVAVFQPAASFQFSAAGVLFFEIDAFGSAVGDMDPDAESPMHSIMQGTFTTSPNLVAGPTEINSDPCFTINGSIIRTDRPPTQSGYGTDVTIPVHNALVDIREEDLIFDDSYGEVLTDANGNFSKSFCDDDGWFDDELEIYIRLRAELKSGGHTVVEVEDSSWIDEVYEYDSWVVDSEGGTISFNVGLNNNQSAVFNIADAIFDSWNYWNESGGEAGGDSIFDEAAEVHWEPGYGDDGSYYVDFWGEITIADDPSDPDQWDESVIIHEWGHMADDEYSCDDNPGGTHFVNQLVGDPELAWGEGYPDYWQSAVRADKGYIDSSFYIDINGGGGGIFVDLEPRDVNQPTLVSTLSEFAIAAALWDLNDNVNDGQDQVNHGHAMIQDVYTSGTFEDVAYGFWDDDCDFDNYMRAWVQRGKPADAPTAAAILQNTGYTLPPATMAYGPFSPVAVQTAGEPVDSVWWNQITYILDNSASMNGDKFDGAKVVVEETINDLGVLPEGTEFNLVTFNNTSFENQTAFAGQFFPENLTAAVNGLSTSGAADGDCDVFALHALAQAIEGQVNGDVWLFTDGDTWQIPSVESLTHLLNEHEMRASIALMGLCPALLQAPELGGNATLSQIFADLQAGHVPEDPAAAEALIQQNILAGMAAEYLGPAAAETPGGLVPYLLTALNSGGQFLFVDASQTQYAADILRAQITNSAGAGTWSDYVSDLPTYRWDRLPTWESVWVDASPANGGTSHGYHIDDGYINVPIPPLTYYDDGPHYMAHVYANGYVTFGSYFGEQNNNTTLPNPAAPNYVIYPFWDSLNPQSIPCSSPAGCGTVGRIYSKQEGDWFAIEYFKYDSFSDSSLQTNTFEVLLNSNTGEIRYLYDTVPDGAASATIGLENHSGSSGVQVSYNDINGAIGDEGYKFTPAPPQPTKTYTVPVDVHMDAIGFLLTGYSGSFEPLAIYDPNDNLVSCAEPGALCLDLDLVQYVQVNTNGRVGDWYAVVDAGSTGEGTFSFISIAASPIAVDSSGDHTLSIAGGYPLFVNLGLAVDGNALTGWFTQPDDTPCGSPFALYDDGAHGDNAAGDGIFGSPPYFPAGACTAYLRVEGTLDGGAFQRIDPVPYSFQPVSIESLGDGANFGGGTTLQFELHNADVHDHWYLYSYQAPEGWWLDGLGVWGFIHLSAGQTFTEDAIAYMGAGYTNDLPSGTTGEFALTITEIEEGIISDSATARVTRYRDPDAIAIHNPTFILRPGGDSTVLDVFVVDAQNAIVADGTLIQMSADTGVVSPTLATTEGGFFRVIYTSGAGEGTATITAMASNGITDTTTIKIGEAPPNQIELFVSTNHLPADGTSTATLVATVYDRWGTPVPNQLVQIGIEGDGQLGTINGGDVISGTTDINGQFTAMLTAGTEIGEAGVRAELMMQEDGEIWAAQDDREVITFGDQIFLPLLIR